MLSNFLAIGTGGRLGPRGSIGTGGKIWQGWKRDRASGVASRTGLIQGKIGGKARCDRQGGKGGVGRGGEGGGVMLPPPSGAGFFWKYRRIMYRYRKSGATPLAFTNVSPPLLLKFCPALGRKNRLHCSSALVGPDGWAASAGTQWLDSPITRQREKIPPDSPRLPSKNDGYSVFPPAPHSPS